MALSQTVVAMFAMYILTVENILLAHAPCTLTLLSNKGLLLVIYQNSEGNRQNCLINLSNVMDQIAIKNKWDLQQSLRNAKQKLRTAKNESTAQTI